VARAAAQDGGSLPDGRYYRRLGAALLLAALGWLVWRVVEPVWHPLAWAVLLGTLLAPAQRRLVGLGAGPSLAATVTMFLTVLALVLPLALVAEQVAVQARNLHQGSLGSAVDAGQVLADPLGNLPWLEERLGRLAAPVNVSIQQLHGWFAAGVQALARKMGAYGGVLVHGALGAVASVALMLFVLFYVLRDGPGLAARLVPMLPLEAERRTLLWRHLSDVTRAVFLGIGVAALAHGGLIGIGAWLAGVQGPLLVGTLAALLALIPVVGSALVWVPCVALLAVQGHTGAAIFLAAWSVLLVGAVDHVLRPVLISGRASIPTLPVFLGVLGGLHAFGLLGLFAGPIVLSVLVALFRYEHEQLEAMRRPAAGELP
jgi:predicted PurR-regulated permease PerM